MWPCHNKILQQQPQSKKGKESSQDKSSDDILVWKTFSYSPIFKIKSNGTKSLLRRVIINN